MTTLYLVRHGETEDNVNQIMQGQTHGRLTANGIAQAQQVRDQMASESFAAIIASDLKKQFGWQMTTTTGFGSRFNDGETVYSVRILRSSLSNRHSY